MEVLVDYYNLDNKRLDCKLVEVPKDNDISMAIQKNLGTVIPIDELTIYLKGYNPIHIEYPYHASAIFEYLFVAMCNNGATQDEFEEIIKNINEYRTDGDVDKDFICKMVMKYVDFD